MTANYTYEEWSLAFLSGIGNSNPSAFVKAFVKAWGMWETDDIGAGAMYNMLNTTEDGAGSIKPDFNPVGVKNFDTLAHGVAANVAALIGGPVFYYPDLAKALQTNDEAALRSPSQEIQAELVKWGTGHALDIAAKAVTFLPAPTTPAPKPPPKVVLNGYGDTIDVVNVSQFPGKGLSPDMCVAYAAAIVRFAGQATHRATGTPAQVTKLAEFWYNLLTGNLTNTAGMNLDQLHTMLSGMGLSWYAVGTDMNDIKAAIGKARPVLIQAPENSYYDVALGDIVPYTWNTTGINHCIVASGVAKDGVNLLCHDTANIDVNGVIRKGPRIYDASKMRPFAGTGIILPWSH